MSCEKDLTRWNRSGLDRFRYIDGNAVTFLEILREATASRFPDYQGMEMTLPAGDTPSERIKRTEELLKQYNAPRRDLLWEILRGMARSCHVLAKHIDIYANEGYLKTATQWDSVRSLVEMIDYHPAPPASAATLLALEIKAEKKGILSKGFQVKNLPAGGPSVIFETLDDLAVDADFNAMRLSGYGCSQELFWGKSLVIEGKVEGLSIGQPVIVENEKSGAIQGRLIAGLTVTDKTTTVELHQPLSRKSGFVSGKTLIYLKPAERLAPFGPGKGGETLEMIGKVIHLEDIPADLRPEEILFISDGWRMYFRRVLNTQGCEVHFDQAVGNLSLQGAYAARARLISVIGAGSRFIIKSEKNIFAVRVSGDLSCLAKTWAAKILDPGGELAHFRIEAAPYYPVDKNNPDGGGYTIIKLIDPDKQLVNPQTLWVMPVGRTWNVDTYLDRGAENLLPKTVVAEIPKKTGSGDLIAIKSGVQLAWGFLANLAIDEEKGQADFTVKEWHHRGGGRFYLKDTCICGRFKEQKRLLGWDRNDTRVNREYLSLQDSAIASKLPVGRCLLIEHENSSGPSYYFETIITRVSGSQLTVSPPLPLQKVYTVADTVLRGNIISAGHGERKPAKVLGSGDAIRSNQSFILKVKDISFVADATQPSGVRADIEITVEGRAWKQVGTLNDSGPADHHYVVQMTEEGLLKVLFGDGSNGRRLPGGINNIRVLYRTGTGASGNLEAGSLTKIVKPNPLIKAVCQPFDAAGGNDMEETESMRTNAPATVLTLNRGVSLTDFANLAVSHSMVWQARAFIMLPTGRNERVEVVVVPAGGRLSNELKNTLKNYLQNRAVPGIDVQVCCYQSLYLALDVLIRVKSNEYQPDTVKEQVRTQLCRVFSVQQRKIGQPVYLSEIYHLIEEIAGVENSHCILKPLVVPPESDEPPPPIRGRDDIIKALRAGERQLICLASRGSGLIIDHEEYQV